MEMETGINCAHCKQEVNGRYCPNCGDTVIVKRVDAHYVIHEIQHFLHFEKGIPYTIKELILRPGKSVREFVRVNRNRLVKPILFLIVTSLIYTWMTHLFHAEVVETPEMIRIRETALGAIFDWVQSHYGYANILMGLSIALWLKLFFGKYDYNFFEILILLCFLIGVGMLIFSVFFMAGALLHVDLSNVSVIFGIGYCVWGIGQFFDAKKAVNYLMALIAYLLGMIIFWIVAVAVGITIDLINHAV